MILDTPDYQKIKTSFLNELTAASKGKDSSVSFIKNELPNKTTEKNPFQAIVVGGSNFVSATPTDGNLTKRTQGSLPIFNTATDFEKFLLSVFEPDISALALNFAYPISPIINEDNLLDGRLINGTKEHAFKGLVGQNLGEFVKKTYFAKFEKEIPVSVANDTICLALSGSGQESGGMVLGSGFNISLRIINEHKTHIINLEAGNFDKFESDKILEEIDSKSENKGINRFEKMLSGNYLWLIYNFVVERYGLNIQNISNSKSMSQLAYDDKTKSGDLAREILTRSASLVASTISAIYEFLNKSEELTLITEGSLFWNGWNYQENMEKKLKEIGVPKNKISFKKIPDSSIKGALGLMK